MNTENYRIPRDIYEFLEDRETVPAADAVAVLRAIFPELEPLKKWASDPEPYGYNIPYTYCGDYGGCLEYRSNARILAEECPTLTEETGDTYGDGLMLRHPEDGEEWPSAEVDYFADALAALDGYPILDEGHASELEWEARGESWDSDGEDDTRRALENALDEDCPLRMEPNTDALMEWAEDREWWGDVLWNCQSAEYAQVWTDGEAVARAILDNRDETAPDLYRLAWWADPTDPEFGTARAFGHRMAAWNTEHAVDGRGVVTG